MREIIHIAMFLITPAVLGYLWSKYEDRGSIVYDAIKDRWHGEEADGEV